MNFNSKIKSAKRLTYLLIKQPRYFFYQLQLKIRTTGKNQVAKSGKTKEDDQHRANADFLIDNWQRISKSDLFWANSPAINQERSIVVIGEFGVPQCLRYRGVQLGEIAGLLDSNFICINYTYLAKAIDAIQTASVVIFYRLRTDYLFNLYVMECDRLGIPYIYDIDDPLFDPAVYSTYSNLDYVPWFDKAGAVLRSVDYRTAMKSSPLLSSSTPTLAKLMNHHTGSPAFLRRNFADKLALKTGKEVMENSNKSDPMILFSSGSFGHEADLQMVIPALEKMVEKVASFEFKIVGNFDKSYLPKTLLSNVSLVKKMEYSSYLKELGNARAVVLPLVKDQFNNTKSAVRYLDAAAVGTTVIASNFGDFPNVVANQETGFLVEEPSEWEDTILSVLESQTLATKLGKAARQDIETRFSANLENHIISCEMVDILKN